MSRIPHVEERSVCSSCRGPFGLTIKSCYRCRINTFNNEDPLSDVLVIIPKVVEPLSLHRLVLSEASVTLKVLFEGKPNSFCVYGANAQKPKPSIEWKMRKCDETDEHYPNVVVKWLRFCYGEDQCFAPEECPAALAALTQLQLSFCDIQQALEVFMMDSAKSDVSVGTDMVLACAQYPECRNSSLALARCVMCRENLTKQYDLVVDKCLMNLPPDYLDVVEYGSAHTVFSGFSIRLRYVRYHESLTSEQKSQVMKMCDPSELDLAEVEQLVELGLMNKDDAMSSLKQMLISTKADLTRQTDRVESLQMLCLCLLFGVFIFHFSFVFVFCFVVVELQVTRRWVNWVGLHSTLRRHFIARKRMICYLISFCVVRI